MKGLTQKIPWQRGMYASVSCTQSSNYREYNFTSATFFFLSSPLYPFAALQNFTLLPLWRNSSNVAYRTHLFFTASLFLKDPSPWRTCLSWMCCESKRKRWYCKSTKNKRVYKCNEKPWPKYLECYLIGVCHVQNNFEAVRSGALWEWFNMRRGQLFMEDIYDLRTNRVPSVWSAQCLCSYKEQLCSRETRGQNRAGSTALAQ